MFVLALLLVILVVAFLVVHLLRSRSKNQEIHKRITLSGGNKAKNAPFEVLPPVML